MTNRKIDIIESMRIKSLSSAERDKVWETISSKLSSTPALSPLRFPFRAIASCAVIVLITAGTINVANNAHMGEPLFALDTAVERIESSINPSSRADHAQERLAEFQALVPRDRGNTTLAKTSPMANSVNDHVTDTGVMLFSAEHETEKTILLSTENEALIESTRAILQRIANQALNDDDDIESFTRIMQTIQEFETYVQTLRSY